MTREEVRNFLNNINTDLLAVRGVDEELEVGQILGTSYQWDYDTDQSSFYTDNPVELGGVCGQRIEPVTYNRRWGAEHDNIGEQIDAILETIESHKEYNYDHNYLITGEQVYMTVQDDPDEVVIEDAEVLIKTN